MKIILKDFQEAAVSKLVRHLRGASRDSLSGDRQSVCLSSTTGSGKTVMLTRAIELILDGDDEHVPIKDATFLWVTDDPQLNEQTRKKMVATSSILKSEQLVVVDASFDEETLIPGAVHFINIQKLGKEKNLITPGDKRTYSFWETIRNTIDMLPGKFFVVIDEAHRGMIEETAQEEAATIVQKFIKGSPGEVPAVPIVVGISATPERFNRLIVGTSRANRPVDVDVADVRESGLIKDTIVLHHPKREQPADMTLLREAASALKRFTAQWAGYCAAQEEFTVQPLLIVQVEDSGSKGAISETDIAEAIRMLRNELGDFVSSAFAHSFQEGTTLTIGADEVRYIAPSEIQNDFDVRVIFFKSSLNTGWDCPRAEVMMSFRTAADFTYIAQLVGRMVRAPLARRIVDNELLNTVPLYLPHYDSKALQRIISKLSKPDDGAPPIDIEKSDDVVELQRALESDRYFAALSALPSYVVPRRRKANQVRRLMKFARLLTNDGIDVNAVATARDTLTGVLNAEYERQKNDPRFKEMIEGKRRIAIEAINWDVGALAGRTGSSTEIDIAAENVEDLFEATGRRLNEGLHKIWWRDRVNNGSVDREKAKLELFALCTDPSLIKRVESSAQERVQSWLSAHRTAISGLDEGSRAQYTEIRNLAASPELSPLVYPAALQARASDGRWAKHLYVSADGDYQADFNNVERAVLNQEIGRSDVSAWLRNVDRKPWALCVPYDVDGEDRAMYPDFLVVRDKDGQLIVDIIDPHAISLADAPAKAAGLAKFAAKHADRFGRIELIMVDGSTTKTFDLTSETVRNRVRGLKLHNEMKRLFDEAP
ncbi:DEAD/DEAH box helicase family protein [Mesorhizobium sp. WSM3224]|uniref:DEAD/DEAH box helicase family protein n=1 Tax=Mesorhizobium sp. WSM3224 TaxID=1040986 RepID=UPI00040B5780|nr:DEAD/DEAH box helicase family protein [Mesorhizobium sp. WSM3224]